jgi:hypothetical protein
LFSYHAQVICRSETDVRNTDAAPFNGNRLAMQTDIVDYSRSSQTKTMVSISFKQLVLVTNVFQQYRPSLLTLFMLWFAVLYGKLIL